MTVQQPGRRGLRTLAALGVVAALAATGTVVALTRPGAEGTSVMGGLDAVPVGFRLVGLGHVGLLVPASWADNALSCGTPSEDTVIVDPPLVQATCYRVRPEGVEAVRVSPTRPKGTDVEGRLDGVRVLRRPTTCVDEPPLVVPKPGAKTTPQRLPHVVRTRLCTGAIWVPSQRVGVEVTSTTSAATGDDVLSRVRMVPGAVGVPSLNAVRADVAAGDGKAVVGGAFAVEEQVLEEYQAQLARLGLRAEAVAWMQVDERAWLVASPRPGTMLLPGSVVTLTWRLPPGAVSF